MADIPSLNEHRIYDEMIAVYPELEHMETLTDAFAKCVEITGRKIVFVIDEWDAPIREDEQALRYVIKFAYIAAIDQYLKVKELPSGKGIADVVYLPKRRSPLPALIIELKWDKSSEAAIRQIKERNYPAVLRDYGGGDHSSRNQF
ncbi:MAG: hypothetical protein J6M66_08030 [Lachnospiraceae bacterium]|nr:hypothetical protein [Lachnospiraceae bacterium]